MPIAEPRSFTYRGEENKSVLLLHGFTGNTADVRMLGKYLHQHAYTCHAPLYSGHGLDPDKLIRTGPHDWWQDALDGYNFLKAEGYKEIAVVGVSLGGVFSLKLGTKLPVTGIVSVCAPILAKRSEDLYKRVWHYAKIFKSLEGKSNEQVHYELTEFERLPMPSLIHLQNMIAEMREKLALITKPLFVLQGCLDETLYRESAEIIYNFAGSANKQLKWYEHSKHVITLEKEREKVFRDIYLFLEELDW